MKLSHFFIDHPRFAAVINIFITVFGLAAAAFLPVAQYPNIVPPTVQITTTYPGATAETIARTVATPLEQAINGVENMDYISSQSTSDGLLTITVIFKIGTDINTALMLTNNRVQDTLSRLPEEVQLEGVQVKKTIPALLLGVHPYSPDGSRSAEYISNYMILHVRDEIKRLPGVADIWTLGERQYAMRIWVNPDKAAADNISASDIVSAIRAQNAQVSAGALNQPPVLRDGSAAYQTSVEALGRLTKPEQFGEIIVKSDSRGRVTRIRDIGHVELGSADYSSIAYADRYPSAPFWVIATPGADVVKVEHEVWDKMAQLKKSFPSGLDYIDIYDPTTFVSQSIHEVIKTIGIAIILVVGVVYVFLQSWRATIIPVVAIPVSLVGAFSILAALGTSINNLSLFGLVLAVGIVVDDAIVVVENVERNMALGMPAREAAHHTMDEVSGALIAIALTLCAVFIPTAFISGISGLFFTQFATTIAASTVISCFVSLTLSPALSAVLLKPHHARSAHAKRWGIGRIVRGVFGLFNAGFDWLSSSYGKMTSRLVRATAVILVFYVGLNLAHRRPILEDADRFYPGSGHRLPRRRRPAPAGLQPRPDRRSGSGSERHHPENPRHRAHFPGGWLRRHDKYQCAQRGDDLPRLALAIRSPHSRRERRDGAGSRTQAPSRDQGCVRSRNQSSARSGSGRCRRLQDDGRGPEQSRPASPRQCHQRAGCGRQQGSGFYRRLHSL
jgi:hydrophobe/amphiphile efflux-1 (HAE1) family protein